MTYRPGAVRVSPARVARQEATLAGEVLEAVGVVLIIALIAVALLWWCP